MRIPTWRLALTGAAIAILAVTGIGLVAAATAPATPAAAVAAADPTRAPSEPSASGDPGTDRAGKVRERFGAARLLRMGRHLVHVEATIVGKDDALIVIHLDHGTVQSIGGGSLVIAEAGGTTETVTIDDKTIVHLGREDGDLGDVTAGAEIFVQSRVDGSTVLAKRILVVPAKAT